MAKKKKQIKAKQSSKILMYIAWSLSIIALLLSATLVGYFIGYDNAKSEYTPHVVDKKEHKKQVPAKQDVSQRLKEVLKKEVKKEPRNYISASHEFDGSSVEKIPEMLQRKRVVTSTKPKLAIIIDDVGTRSQVKAIKSLHLPLTMSFLPPSKGRPNTPKLAAKEPFYMIHLPMEAMNWNAEEPFTLRIHDSQQVISQRIAKIKELFPKVHYINNHTGSKFTADETAMNRLIYALKQKNIYFIDSRTTAQTKAPKVLKNFGLKYLSRDVFLDHHMEKEYVLKQIKQAIKVAKRHGSAIAIGHPHKNTLQALSESKKLLKEVDLVLVDRI